MKLILLLPAALFAGVLSSHAAPFPSEAEVEQKVNAIMEKMTFEEKARLCIGGSSMSFAGVPRVFIPEMGCTDGPRGPKHPQGIAFPAGPGQSASWNPELLEQIGEVIGKETRARNSVVLLGPALKILRDSLGESANRITPC